VLLFLTYPLLVRLFYLHLYVEIKKLSVGPHSWASITALTALTALPTSSTELPGGGKHQQLRAHLSAASFTSICHLPRCVCPYRGSWRVIYTIYTHTFKRAPHCYDISCLRSYPHHHHYLLMPLLSLAFTARYLFIHRRFVQLEPHGRHSAGCKRHDITSHHIRRLDHHCRMESDLGHRYSSRSFGVVSGVCWRSFEHTCFLQRAS
jgi:hypothetical protein